MRNDLNLPIYVFITFIIIAIYIILFKGLLFGQQANVVDEYDRANNWIELDSKYLVYYDKEKPNYIFNRYDISYIIYGKEKNANSFFIVVYFTRGQGIRYEYSNYYIYEQEMKKLLGRRI